MCDVAYSKSSAFDGSVERDGESDTTTTVAVEDASLRTDHLQRSTTIDIIDRFTDTSSHRTA